MKKLFLILIALFITIHAISQTTFTIGDLKYKTIDATTVKIIDCSTSVVSVTIPSIVSNEGNDYKVTEIATNAFKNCSTLTSIVIPDNIITIKNNAFLNCSNLTSITLPQNATIQPKAFETAGKTVTINDVVYGGNDTLIISNYTLLDVGFTTFYLEGNAYKSTKASVISCNKEKNGSLTILSSIELDDKTYPVTFIKGKAFYDCGNITSITLPNSIIYIGRNGDLQGAFENCGKLTYITIGNNVKSIEHYSFYNCAKLDSIICLAETAPKLGDDLFIYTPTKKKLTIPFGSDYSSWKNATEWGQVNHKINAGDTIILSNTFEITTANKRAIINDGVLVIEQGGQLVNLTETDVEGVIEVKTKSLPYNKWSFIGAPFDGYKLEAIKPGTNDVSVSVFDYEGEGAGDWSNDWATINTEIEKGEGFFVWSFAQEPTTFTTNGDVGDYSINNDTVIEVTKSLTENEGYWMALANPYPFKLDVSKFIANNANNIQGQNGIYLLDENGAFQYVTDGTINVTEGFFVNFIGSGNNTAVFKKEQRKLNSNKDLAKRDFIQLTMLDGENKSELLFARNENAKHDYDIYDANKLFSPMEITEAYFLTEGKALIKEEVDSLPYYATLNVKSYESKEVSFRVDNIPEGICVFLLDNENDIRMKEGMEYTANIVAGENEDRFKLLVKKAYKITEEVTHDIFIHNTNRIITISSSQKDLKTEIYDTLGRKVFETKECKFQLNELPTGVYMIKAFNRQAYESKKILIK